MKPIGMTERTSNAKDRVDLEARIAKVCDLATILDFYISVKCGVEQFKGSTGLSDNPENDPGR